VQIAYRYLCCAAGVWQTLHEDAGRRYVDSEMAALELEQAETDQLASSLETQLRAVMKSGVLKPVLSTRLSIYLSTASTVS